jgi:hypothetical protein
VTRCSTQGFVGAVHLPQPDLPVFGTFCKAEAQQGMSQVIAVIYDIRVDDDEFARQLATVDSPAEEHITDHQENRQMPVGYSALSIGFQTHSEYTHALPPQPPLTLAPIHALTDDEIRKFTERLGFIRLILTPTKLPTEDLLAASLQVAARTRPSDQRESFLVEAGRYCARLLGDDLNRLSNLIENIRT